MTRTLYAAMKAAIVEGDKATALELAETAVSSGTSLLEVIERGYLPGLQEVGELWERGDYFLPELIASAEAMKAAMGVIGPRLAAEDRAARSGGKVVIGTVEGDIHDIGKNLVAALLRAAGFEVHDLGADVKPERFLETAEVVGADIIGLSALLTTTMLNQKRLIALLRERNLRDRYMVMVGGAPATRAWAEEIGADGFAENAMAAVREARALLARRAGRAGTPEDR